jgi:hypothetical protein
VQFVAGKGETSDYVPLRNRAAHARVEAEKELKVRAVALSDEEFERLARSIADLRQLEAALNDALHSRSGPIQ